MDLEEKAKYRATISIGYQSMHVLNDAACHWGDSDDGNDSDDSNDR